MVSTISFNLDQSKIFLSGNGLKGICYEINKEWNMIKGFNSLSNDKILEWSKLKANADNRINMAQKSKFDME